MRRHVRLALRILLGVVACAWWLVPVGTWKGFVVFASLTMLFAAVALAYGWMEDEDRKKETQQ